MSSIIPPIKSWASIVIENKSKEITNQPSKNFSCKNCNIILNFVDNFTQCQTCTSEYLFNQTTGKITETLNKINL